MACFIRKLFKGLMAVFCMADCDKRLEIITFCGSLDELNQIARGSCVQFEFLQSDRWNSYHVEGSPENLQNTLRSIGADAIVNYRLAEASRYMGVPVRRVSTRDEKVMPEEQL
jgi:hypothetical protein